MSGAMVTSALCDRFDAIRRSEIQRLSKKLRGLTEDERSVVESITTDIIYAIARIPERACGRDPQPRTIDALVQLFGL